MSSQKEIKLLTKEEWISFNNATKCHICLKIFGKGEKKNIKVRDHCHYTGQYRGAAHKNCNLRFKIPSYIPIAFHNLSGCDAHLVIKELARQNGHGSLRAIAKNKEKYISFSVDVVVDQYKDKNGELKERKMQLRFIDTEKFMNSSLDNLSKNLTDEKCKILRQYYNNEEMFKVMRRKGVYPYEYMDDFKRFSEKELPPKEAFHSKLNLSSISDEDYKHAQNVWNALSEKKLGHYHDIYLKSDVLLLADVFETFRDTCMKHYSLDPAHFYTSPGLSWQACLKKTDVTLDLLSDLDMFVFMEK